VSTNGTTNGTHIHVLLVGEMNEARRLCGLIDSDGSTPFHTSHISDPDLTVERLSGIRADVLLLDMGSKQRQRRELVETVRAAAPDIPVVILSESEDDELALEALQQGVQDFLAKACMDRTALVRSLRYSIERHRLQKMLHSLSLTDDLTGLSNRRGFMALAEQHLRVIIRKGSALLIYLDLDDLKVINDSYGHLEGNRALVVTANVLRACFRQSDILARMGGDEFCVLMTDAGEDSVHQVRKRLQQRVDSIDGLSSWRFRLSLSVGIAEVSATHQPSLEDLIRVADANMYEEKRNKSVRTSVSTAGKQSPICS
jgi:two-component system, cell cycle response regulator